MREMRPELVSVKMGAVEPFEVITLQFHLIVDGPGHNVARSERSPYMVFRHELLPGPVSQLGPETPQSLGDQE